MIRKCCQCGFVMGTKPPYWDMSITAGFCDPCFRTELEKIEQYHKNKGGKSNHENLEIPRHRIFIGHGLDDRPMDDQYSNYLLGRKT